MDVILNGFIYKSSKVNIIECNDFVHFLVTNR